MDCEYREECLDWKRDNECAVNCACYGEDCLMLKSPQPTQAEEPSLDEKIMLGQARLISDVWKLAEHGSCRDCRGIVDKIKAVMLTGEYPIPSE